MPTSSSLKSNSHRRVLRIDSLFERFRSILKHGSVPFAPENEPNRSVTPAGVRRARGIGIRWYTHR
jgi:hypothetical protein